jgi:hypothetical protein
MCNYNLINAEVITDTEAVGLQARVTRVGQFSAARHTTRWHYRVTPINFNNFVLLYLRY